MTPFRPKIYLVLADVAWSAVESSRVVGNLRGQRLHTCTECDCFTWKLLVQEEAAAQVLRRSVQRIQISHRPSRLLFHSLLRTALVRSTQGLCSQLVWRPANVLSGALACGFLSKLVRDRTCSLTGRNQHELSVDHVRKW